MRRVLFTVLVLGLLVGSTFAQEAGQINGTVADSSGGVIPGVTVSAVESGTGISRETVTGANGRYQFAAMRPTTYEIRAELAGFRTVRQTDVILAANQNLTLNITLQLGDLSETVTVAGEAASVDITQGTIAEVVDSKRIVELPLNGRDAARLSMLVAGTIVTRIDQESGKTIPGALRLSTNGTESRQASFRLDGTNHTDFVLPAESAVSVSRCATGVQHSDQQLQRGTGRQRRRRGERGHPLGHQQSPRRRVRLPTR